MCVKMEGSTCACGKRVSVAGTSCGHCDGRPVGRPQGQISAICSVRQNGMHLRDLPEQVRENRVVVLEAVSSTSTTLEQHHSSCVAAVVILGGCQ